MTVNLNLLPASYIRDQRHELWFKRSVALGVSIIVAEFALGLVLHLRAGGTREIEAEVTRTHQAVSSLKQELLTATNEASRVKKNLVLVEQLKRTHHWSRLLGAVAHATPEGVVLSGLATDPPQWLKGSETPQATQGKTVASGGKGSADKSQKPVPSVKGIVIRGYAADHDGLAKLVANLHASRIFSAVNIERMERNQYEGRDAVAFELRGCW